MHHCVRPHKHCGCLYGFFVLLSYCRLAHAVVFLMSPVFMARHCVLPLLSTLLQGLFDTLRADTHSEWKETHGTR